MSPVLVLSTIFFYFVILFLISYFAGRKADNQGFFVGNRKSAWYLVAFAMIGLQYLWSNFCFRPRHGGSQ